MVAGDSIASRRREEEENSYHSYKLPGTIFPKVSFFFLVRICYRTVG